LSAIDIRASRAKAIVDRLRHILDRQGKALRDDVTDIGDRLPAIERQRGIGNAMSQALQERARFLEHSTDPGTGSSPVRMMEQWALTDSGRSIAVVTSDAGAKAASGLRDWVASNQAAVSRTVRLTQPFTPRSSIDLIVSSPALRPREGLKSDQAAGRRAVPDRAEPVAGVSDRYHAGRDRRRATPGGTAGCAIEVPGIARRAN
jgi:hypothetical protein